MEMRHSRAIRIPMIGLAAIQAEIWDIEYGTTAWGTTGFDADLTYLEWLVAYWETHGIPETDSVQLSGSGQGFVTVSELRLLGPRAHNHCLIRRGPDWSWCTETSAQGARGGITKKFKLEIWPNWPSSKWRNSNESKS